MNTSINSIKLRIKKIFFSTYAVIAVFIILQLCFKVLHLDTPSDDFKYFYWPNANNIQHIGYEFESLDGEKFVADGDIERFGYMPQGYTYMVAAIIKMGGGLNTILFINIMLLAFTIYIAKKVFNLITDNKFIIYISLWILVLNPVFINIPRLFLSEGLFSLLTISSMYFYIVSLKNKKWLSLIVAVLLMLASIEIRSINLYLLPVLAIPFLFVKLNLIQKLGYLALSLVAFFTTINLHSNNNATYLRRTMADGLSRFEENVVAEKLHYSVRPKQADWKETFKSEIIIQLKEHPLEFCKLYMMKFVKAWYATDSGDNEVIILLFQLIHFIAFIILLILFLIRKLWDPKIFLLLLVILYTNLIITATFSICRYMSPIAPLYIFCTVWLGSMIYGKYFEKKELTTDELRF